MQFASGTVSGSEKKYASCEREALAFMFILKRYKVYPLPSLLSTVISDH